MTMTDLKLEFIQHFGEMGSRWGINRTVGQVYALLFISDRPLCAEDIVAELGVSRSNVSMSLKELQAWELVRLSRKQNDRRDYFTTPQDLWEIVRTLIAQRKKREIDPTLTKLRELEMRDVDAGENYAHARIAEMRELIENMTEFYEQLDAMETERLVALLKMGSKLQKLVATPTGILSRGRKLRS